MRNKTYFNACPKCGSISHHTESDLSWMTGKSPIYVCNDCGYSSGLFPEVERKELKKFRSAVKSKAKKSKKFAQKAPAVEIDSIIALVVGVLVLFSFGPVYFVLIVGGYFTVRHLVRRCY